MIKDDEIELISNKPSIIFIGFAICAILFPSEITFLLYHSQKIYPMGASEATAHIIFCTIVLFFILMIFLGIYLLLSTKSVILTTKNLYLRRPFIFYTYIISLDEIKSIKQENYKTNFSHRGSNHIIHKGKKITIELANGKKIEITSLEIFNCNALYIQAKKALAKRGHFFEVPKCEESNYDGLGWIIFMISIISGLLYALIKENGISTFSITLCVIY